MNITVTPGEVRVASVHLMSAADGFVWLSIDCSTKRPVVGGLGGGDGHLSVWLDAGEGTLHVDESKRGTSTAVRIDGYGDGWTIEATASRYTVNVFLTKWPAREDVRCLWTAGAAGVGTT